MKSVLFCPCLAPAFMVMVLMKERNEKIDKPVLPKFTIAEMDLFDVPMVGVFKNKEYTAYTLSTLAGIEIDNLDDMEITVEDFMANPEEGKRNMRMDARINIKRGEERANIEIQRIMTNLQEPFFMQEGL